MKLKNPLKSPQTPRILLVGAGRFGQHYVRILKDLHKEKKIDFVGVVVQSEKSRKKIELEQNIKVYTQISDDLLKKVEAVCVVTPPETHFEIVSKCLKYADVFVEKPIASTTVESKKLVTLAKKYKRELFVGHIFRHDPILEQLKKIIGNKRIPKKINGKFINPITTDSFREPSFEFLHLFDVVDFIWKPKVHTSHARSDGRVSIVDIRYEDECDARFELGWRLDEKTRSLQLNYPNLVVDIDFIARTITQNTKDSQNKTVKRKVYNCPIKTELIRKEIIEFLGARRLKDKSLANHSAFSALVDGSKGAHIVSIAERGVPVVENRRPRVAIIGGGIFGTSVAGELGSFCDVTIFEKNREIMQEATLVNCSRHHHGFHYPRSDETVRDIQTSRADFENIFKDAIDDFPTYYGLAKENSFVSYKEFIQFCKRNKLPYEKVFPGKHVLNKKEIALSIKVPERSYHHGRLKSIVEKRLKSLPNVHIVYEATVIGASLQKGGNKKVTYVVQGSKKEHTQEFDFLVNATYASINNISNWMGFEHYPIRVDLAEVVILRLPIEPISLTIIDGPFSTLMSTGNPNEFSLYHVTESILDRYVPKKGLVKKQLKQKSNRENILNKSLKWFPILKEAEIIESRIVNRGVQANVEHSDARVADLIEHGFGCWSILSGKILSSVTLSKRLAEIIRVGVSSSQNPIYPAHPPFRKTRR